MQARKKRVKQVSLVLVDIMLNGLRRTARSNSIIAVVFDTTAIFISIKSAV
jgi:hypothetical protein